MFLCKDCLSKIVGISDEKILKFYWCVALIQHQCEKCNKITDVDFISDKEIEYIKNDKK